MRGQVVESTLRLELKTSENNTAGGSEKDHRMDLSQGSRDSLGHLLGDCPKSVLGDFHRDAKGKNYRAAGREVFTDSLGHGWLFTWIRMPLLNLRTT